MQNESQVNTSLSFSASKVIIIFGVIVLVLLIFAPGFYFYQKFQKVQKELTQINLPGTEAGKNILSNVQKLTDLPVDEEPTIITIRDISKVKNQPFFANAKNGDKIILFNKNKKAILYDPLDNKIVEMGPLIMPTVTPENEATSSKIIISP